MRTRSMAITIGLIGAMAVGALATHAAITIKGTPVALGPGSMLWLEGRSNVHDFVSRTAQVKVVMLRDSNTVAPTTPAEFVAMVRASQVKGLEVEVPVTSLHSPKAGIDKNLWQDLKAEAQPVIRFTLADYSITPRASAGDTTLVQAEGSLSIAGRNRSVVLHGRLYRADNGLWLDGSHALLMTDFGVKPRTMMLGALRVKNDVVVHYHLLLTTSNN